MSDTKNCPYPDVPRRNPTWNEMDTIAQLEALRNECRDLRRIVRGLVGGGRVSRLMVQNHEHSDTNGRALFPAAVFEPDNTEPVGYTYDPLK